MTAEEDSTPFAVGHQTGQKHSRAGISIPTLQVRSDYVDLRGSGYSLQWMLLTGNDVGRMPDIQTQYPRYLLGVRADNVAFSPSL